MNRIDKKMMKNLIEIDAWAIKKGGYMVSFFIRDWGFEYFVFNPETKQGTYVKNVFELIRQADFLETQKEEVEPVIVEEMLEVSEVLQ